MSEIEALKNRIWITERCHIKAEKRNRFFELYFHITLALYSISAIGISILGNKEFPSEFSNILTFVSVVTLSLALLVFGFRFGEVAAQHRDCYLKLQSIRGKIFEDHSVLNDEYIGVLGSYPNHRTIDYYDVVITSIFSAKQGINNSTGAPICVGCLSRMIYVFEKIAMVSLAALFFMVPIFLLVISVGILRY